MPNNLPEPRLVSRAFHRDTDRPDPDISLMVMQFGQFLDHDITLTPEADEAEGCCEATLATLHNEDCLAIPVGPADPFVIGEEQGHQNCLEFRFVSVNFVLTTLPLIVRKLNDKR